MKDSFGAARNIVAGCGLLHLLKRPASTQAASEPRVRESLVVSSDWLAKHLNDDALLLFQVGDKDEYPS